MYNNITSNPLGVHGQADGRLLTLHWPPWDRNILDAEQEEKQMRLECSSEQTERAPDLS